MIGIARILSTAVVAGLLLAAPAVRAADGDVVFGLWAGPSSILEIYPAGPGVLRGRVVALKSPVFLADEEGPEGARRTDINNPDPTLRGKPILGMDLLADYQRKGKKWQGEIYDPESGKTYSSNLRIDKSGDLLIRGYVGAPMFGRTATFVPVSRCTDEIVRMLKSEQLSGC